MLADLLNPMVVQWITFLFMASTFVIGIWFVSPHEKKHPHIRVSTTRNEREVGYKYALSSDYRRYRNPMRILRRFCGWPCGRQWVKLRKHWNREYPDGARRFANVVANAYVHAQKDVPAAPAPTQPQRIAA